MTIEQYPVSEKKEKVDYISDLLTSGDRINKKVSVYNAAYLLCQCEDNHLTTVQIKKDFAACKLSNGIAVGKYDFFLFEIKDNRTGEIRYGFVVLNDVYERSRKSDKEYKNFRNNPFLYFNSYADPLSDSKSNITFKSKTVVDFSAAKKSKDIKNIIENEYNLSKADSLKALDSLYSIQKQEQITEFTELEQSQNEKAVNESREKLKYNQGLISILILKHASGEIEVEKIIQNKYNKISGNEPLYFDPKDILDNNSLIFQKVL
ncbi:MAG: hypothetical protein H7Y00_09685 [Fimbriimonadaceae bacterium]|nr:hypothetical protein [Chitinophagales bacterium]